MNYYFCGDCGRKHFRTPYEDECPFVDYYVEFDKDLIKIVEDDNPEKTSSRPSEVLNKFLEDADLTTHLKIIRQYKEDIKIVIIFSKSILNFFDLESIKVLVTYLNFRPTEEIREYLKEEVFPGLIQTYDPEELQFIFLGSAKYVISDMDEDLTFYYFPYLTEQSIREIFIAQMFTPCPFYKLIDFIIDNHISILDDLDSYVRFFDEKSKFYTPSKKLYLPIINQRRSSQKSSTFGRPPDL